MNFDEKLIHAWLYDPVQFYNEILISQNHSPHSCLEGILLFKKNRNLLDGINEVQSFLNKRKEEQHSSTVVTFIFYFQWFLWSRGLNRTVEAKQIFYILESLATPSSPEFIKAEIFICQSLLFSKDYIELVKKALDIFPPKSIRYQNTICSFCNDFARGGRLNLVDEAYTNHLSKEWKWVLTLIDAIENGQIEKALQYKNEALSNAEMAKLPEVMQSKKEKLISLLDLYVGKNQFSEMNDLLKPTQALLDKNYSQIIQTAIELNRKINMMPGNYTDFFNYTLIRAYLANKNLTVAKKIAESWFVSLNAYCLADFFYARIELLSGNLKEAGAHFYKAKKICLQNNAMGRLDFELELAIELQPKQIRFLMDYSPTPLQIETIKAPIAPKEILTETRGVNEIKGISAAIQAIREDVCKYASSDIPVLILGETGVGKDKIANAIHMESARKSAPFIAINCCTIAESLLQSELFGHEAGAYTGATKAHKGIFETAGNGTVFLDEIGDISSGLQTALLRVLESGECRAVGSSKSRTIHCRIIAATNVLLEEKVDMGLFRMDLFYRLKRLVIKVPPLRERKLDINFLAEYFLNLNADASNKYELSPELKDAFLNYPWPGNVRELKNEIEKMSFLNADRKIFKIEDAEFLNLNNKLNKQNKNKIEDIKTENNTTKAKSPSDKNENIILESGAYFRRIENIMDLFIKHKKLTRKEICQITGAHNFTIGRDLKNLIAQNKIIKVAPTKSPRTHYFEIKP